MILTGCEILRPEAKGAKFLADWVGLRPGREAVRLEREKKKDGYGELIHNYGHGGSGITIFWGCARDVSGLVREIELERMSVAKL